MGSVGAGRAAIQIPSKQSLQNEAEGLKGQALADAIDRADSLGSYYREDKRQKKAYIRELASLYTETPKNWLEVDTNQDVLYIVRNISKTDRESVELAQRWADEMVRR